MSEKAKLFTSGLQQTVQLPEGYRFEGDEVFIRRDPATGDVVLSTRPASWDGFFALYAEGEVPSDFMSAADRNQGGYGTAPFDESTP